jgi:hypothetical protein
MPHEPTFSPLYTVHRLAYFYGVEHFFDSEILLIPSEFFDSGVKEGEIFGNIEESVRGKQRVCSSILLCDSAVCDSCIAMRSTIEIREYLRVEEII